MMKIRFVVNDVSTEQAVFTTTRLAMTATNMGHQSFVLGVGNQAVFVVVIFPLLFVYAENGATRDAVQEATVKPPEERGRQYLLRRCDPAI